MRRSALYASARLTSYSNATPIARTFLIGVSNFHYSHYYKRAQQQDVSYERSQNVLDTLEERGFIKEIAGDRTALSTLHASRHVGAYTGIDPTAPSLHLGHLVPLMVLFWLHAYGHPTVSLIGGATARVGDPSGRLTTRQSMQSDVHKNNLVSIYTQVKGLWDHAEHRINRHGQCKVGEVVPKRQVLNNAVWMDKLSLVDFLRFAGTAARMGTMLGRDTVKNKMTRGDGMSFAEFTYPLLQAWDWWHMYSTMGVGVQIGGSDQYGNIIAGIDTIKHMKAGQEHYEAFGAIPNAPIGLTVPLLTSSSGVKFGKSEGNAIWLDPDMTSSFDLYGFLLRSSDADVGRYLRLFTFLSEHSIVMLLEQHSHNPTQRKAQHTLAFEVLALVHGEEAALRTAEQHRKMRRPTLDSLVTDSQRISDSTTVSQTEDGKVVEAPSTRSRLPYSLVNKSRISCILYHAGLVETRQEGARLVKSGGCYIGARPKGHDEKTDELEFTPVDDKPLDMGQLMANGNILVLRVGKWKVKVIEVVSDDDFDGDISDHAK